ncbi:hypothetical protein AVEN_7410-1 [Araneus ventricosus]|uniref:Uncharacterized protein n=1 Tax=Araneus ventricosus TaxID=182803 RepID=A0A4Y2H251_ARAVE|nr:hypothetical protein AVEN_7410-1 [Araneus ventricosus]
MSVILTNSLLKPISCCVYVRGSTNLTTRVKSVCEKRLWGVVAIKKCVNCQFELQKWTVAPWRRKKVRLGFSSVWTNDYIFPQTISSPSSDEEEVDVPADTNITAAPAKDAIHIMFMECSGNAEKEDFAAIFWIENLVEK